MGAPVYRKEIPCNFCSYSLSLCMLEAVEEIKQAMSGFSLPTSSIPAWAKQVPEDVWKNELIKGLQERKPKK